MKSIFLIWLFISCSSLRSVKTVTPPMAIDDDVLGYYFVDMQSGEVVAEQNADRPFLAASVTKIPTLLAALKILGPSYEFQTKVVLSGNDLYLIGGGDPLLSTSDLMALVQKMKNQGITKIAGKFYYDQSHLPMRTAIHQTLYQKANYNPALSALSINFNVLERSNDREVITYPALHAANLFKKLCEFEGIKLPAPEESVLNGKSKSKVLAIHKSLPLREISARNLEYSNNLISELVMMESAKKLKSTVTSYEEALELFQHWMMKEFQLSDNHLFYYNSASGLAENQLTPKQMVHILRWKNHSKQIAELLPLLPISGVKGTLRGRLGAASYSMRVWAKSGTKNFTNSLSGFLYTNQGKKYAFAIFAHDLERFSLNNENEILDWSKKIKEKMDDVLIRMMR